MEDIDLNKLWSILLTFFLANVLIFGFIGNFLSFKIFTWTKLNKYPISLYFRAISILDSLVLINGIELLIKINFKFFTVRTNDFLCKVDYYFIYLISPISPWIMVVVSFDRFINSAFPKRFLFFHKFRTQLGIILFIVIYNCLLYSFILWTSYFDTSKKLTLFIVLINF